MSRQRVTFVSPTTSSSSAGHSRSPLQGTDGARRAQSTFFGVNGASVPSGSEGNSDPGAGEAASPILQASTVVHRSWPSAVPSYGGQGGLRGEAQRDADPVLRGVTPAAAAKPPDHADGKSANGISPGMAARATAGGAQGQMQSGNDTSERSVAVGSDEDLAAVEESADDGWLGNTAREHSDAVTQKAALPLLEGETEMKSFFLLQAEHGRRNCSILLDACYIIRMRLRTRGDLYY